MLVNASIDSRQSVYDQQRFLRAWEVVACMTQNKSISLETSCLVFVFYLLENKQVQLFGSCNSFIRMKATRVS